ncbi:MAG TPA: hypothetical protein VNS57_13055 [Steroidobacteraceae bacterium]|nr:hypothetical protein [Steroidobacteraceae bacterium]
MKNWIDLMSRIASGLLFQGGYVTSAATLRGGRATPLVDDANRAPGIPVRACGQEMQARA